MSQIPRSSNPVRNAVIVIDFFVFNVLFLLYVEFDYFRDFLSHGADLLVLWMVMNISFFFAQMFFSNVVHHHRALIWQILQRVFMLTVAWTAFNYLGSELVLGYMHRDVPDVRFTLYFGLLLLVGILISRCFERWTMNFYRRRGRNQRRVVFVGSNPSVIPVYEYLIEDPSLGYSCNGYYADEEMEGAPEGLKRKGTLADLANVMKDDLPTGTADELYCCLPEEDAELVRSIMRYCSNNVIHFFYVPSFSELFVQSVRQEVVGETMVFTSYDEPLLRFGNKAMKRAFDIAVSAVVLVCLMPFLPFIALSIKMSSPGPIFFKQKRTGLNGRNFSCYKFRSMHVNKDADKLQATKNDPRKFAFGNFMRKTNIDELPQFFNVLRGDMSIVGPRPHMLHHTEVYRKLIDHYMVRHFVKPGITGWAQVTGFRGETRELWQMEGRVQRDIWYIEHWSIWLDLAIIWKTAKQIIIPDKNAY